MTTSSNSISIETISSQPAALVVGNTHYLGSIVADKLSGQNLKVYHLSEPKPENETLEYLNLQNVNSLTNLNSLKEMKDSPQYCCIISAPEENAKEILGQIHDLTQSTSSFKKILIITTNPRPNYLQQLEQELHQYAQQNQLSIKVLVCHHLFGPGVNPQVNWQLNSLIQTDPQTLSPEAQTQTIHPLLNTKIADFITKLLFTQSSAQTTFHLTGNAISVINFSLLVSDQINQHTQFTSETNQTIQDPSLSSVPKNHLLQPSDSQLNSKNLKTTTDWLKQNFPTPTETSKPDPSPVSKVTTPEPQPHQPVVAQKVVKPKSQPTTPKKTSPPSNKPQNNQPKIVNTDTSQSTDPKSFSFQKLTSIDQSIASASTHERSPNPHPRKSLIKRTIFWLLGIFFTSFVVYAGAFLLNIYLLNTSLQSLQQNLQESRFENIRPQTATIQTHLTILNTQIKLVSPVLKAFFPHQLNTVYSLTNFIDQLSQLAQEMVEVSSTAQELILTITDRQQGNLPLLLTTTRTNLTKIYHTLSEIEADLDTNPNLTQLQTFGVGESVKKFQHSIQSTKPILNQGIQLLANADSLLGFDRKKTYLVLLQNSAELRPTGGFIGSYALVTFESGKLIDIYVQDVYEADGQLKGHVEPPAAVKKYLGEAGWYLRDVNWDPFFPTTAKRAMWFLDKETQVKVDGVVGINLYLVKDLLAATGPIELPDYDMTITSDNMFEKVEYFVEVNQFPGSTQKADILGALSRNLLDRLVNSDMPTTLKSAKQIFDSLNNSQTYMYFNDQKLQTLSTQLGWAGEISPTTCPVTIKSASCTPDHLAVIEANVGINKANYFVTRKYDHIINIDSGLNIHHQLDITIHNSSVSDTWPGGDYKNYLRLYTPPNSQLDSVVVNQQSLSPDQIDTTLEHQNQIYGFLVNTPPGKTTTVTVSYRLGQKLSTQSPTAYSFTHFNQAGTSADPYQLTVNFPESLSILSTSPQTPFEKHSFTSSTQLNKHLRQSFELAR